jgi:hypothetical protein
MLPAFLAAPSRALRLSTAALALTGLAACATDEPTAAVTDSRPAMLAVSALVPRTDAAAGPAAVRITVAYRKQGGALAPLGTAQLFPLDQATQQVPVAIDVATCLADATRAGTGNAAPAADECNIQLTLDLLLNGVRVDQQILTNLSVKPGRTSTISQPVALAQVADVRIVVPTANTSTGAFRLERGRTAALSVQVTDAGGKAITGRDVTWSSSNPAVATVSNTGVVTGVGLGVADVTAAVAGREVAVTSTVVAPSQLITVSSIGTSGRGDVISIPSGISCTVNGAQTTGACSATFPGDVALRLVATAVAPSEFLTFAGECSTVSGSECTLTAPQAPRAVAVAFRNRQSLTVAGGGSGAGSVSANVGGLACAMSGATVSGTCSTLIAEGTSVQLTATATGTSVFQGWTGDCLAATGTVCVVTMDRARSTTARFAGLSAVVVRGGGAGSGTVSSQPSGITCTIDGATVAGTCISSFTDGTVVRLAAVAAPGSDFDGWTGGCTGAGVCAITVGETPTVQANFKQSALPLSISIAGPPGGVVTTSAGQSCVSTLASSSCTFSYTPGTVVRLSASAGAQLVFSGFTGSCNGTGSCDVVMTSARSVTAVFTARLTTLGVSATGSGYGSISSSPSGIACTVSASGTTGTCSSSFPVESSVSLSAVAAPGSVFDGWGGACSGTGACIVTLSRAQDVSATFTRVLVPLTVTVAGPAGASVSASTGETCVSSGGGATCTFRVPAGTSVSLTPGSSGSVRFVGFGGACSGTGSCTVEMTSERSVTATFELPTSVTVSVSRASTSTSTGAVVFGPSNSRCLITLSGTSGACSIDVPPGTSITFTIDPSLGFPFFGWGGACAAFGTNPVCTVTASSNLSVTARF